MVDGRQKTAEEELQKKNPRSLNLRLAEVGESPTLKRLRKKNQRIIDRAKRRERRLFGLFRSNK